MKQDVFEILLYLFETYMYEEKELGENRDELQQELNDAGFRNNEITKAFTWLEDLASMPEVPNGGIITPSLTMRHYSADELIRIDMECRGFLLFLEQMGVLDDLTRELVIERIMALDSNEVDLDQVKWVVLMVLFNQPGREEAAAWMEDMVMEEVASVLH